MLACWGALVAVNYVADPLHWKRMVLTADAVRIWAQAPYNLDQYLRLFPDHLAAAASAIGCLIVGMLAGGGPALWLGVAELPVRMALGLGAGSLLILGLGLAGLFTPGVIWIASAVLAVCGGAAARKRRAAIAPPPVDRSRAAWAPRWVVWTVAGITAASAALNTLGGLAPETGYDSLIQHLADPRAYLRAHRIAFNDLSFLAQHPGGIELLYGAILPAGGDQAAKLLHASFAVLTCWTVQVWLRHRMAGRDAFLLACLLYLTPFNGILSARAYIDHGLTFFAAATLLAPWGSAAQGALIGLAIGTKYLGGFLLFGWCAALGFDGAWRSAGRVAVAASLAAGWWGARNWLTTGNPVYPFAHAVFGGLAWDAHSAGEYGLELSAYGRVEGWAGYLAIPWRVGVRDHGALDDGSLGPLWLIAAPLLWLANAGVPSSPDRTLRRVVAMLWGLWLISPRQVRYALMLLPPTLAMVALVLDAAHRRWPAGWRLAVAALPAVAFVQLQISFAALYLWVNPIYVVGGMMNTGEYLSRIMEPRDSRTGRSLYCDLPMALASSLPASARTYMMGDAKVYYLPGDWRVNALFNPPLVARVIRESHSPGEVARRMRQRGITHMLYNVGGSIHIEYTHHVYRWNDREFSLLEAWATTWWKPLTRLSDSNGDPMYQLYALAPGRYADPLYLPGVDTRVAGVETQVSEGDRRGAGEALAGLERDYPSSGWIRRRGRLIMKSGL